MQIILLPSQNSRPGFLTLVLDGEPWRDIATSIFGKHPKFPLSQSREQFEQFFFDLEHKKVREYVVRRLGSQNYLSYDLAVLLHRKCVSAQTIQDVIAEFSSLGYLDDEQWIRSYIARSSKKKGPRAIAEALRQKGVEQAESRVENLLPQQFEKEMIEQLLRTKYSKRDLKDVREKQKVVAALARKGFSFDQIFSALPEQKFPDSF